MDIVINANIASSPEQSERISGLGNYYQTVLSCLGYPNASPPVADLLRQLLGLSGRWLIVSPVHWQATHNDATIDACGQALSLTEQASRQWCAVLAEIVEANGMRLHYYDTDIWLLSCEDTPPITSKPVYDLQHQSLMLELQRLDNTVFWQRFITEAQMLLSGHPLNQARQGLPAINGVWVWGAGQLTLPEDTPLICDQASLKLAQLLSTNVQEITDFKVSNHRIFLLQALNDQERLALQARLHKHKTHWYWNNIAYKLFPNTWWSRIIERFKAC